jgi:diguanylate cyclase (GGDEF)-like protein/putative nucleotidyltransferase with HDIG domain
MSQTATLQDARPVRPSTPSPATIRLVALVFAAIAFASYVLLAAWPMAPATRVLLTGYCYLLPPALAVAAGAFVVTFTRSATDGPFWYFFVGAGLLLLLGETYQVWYETAVSQARPPVPSISDALLFAGYAVLLGALLSMSSLRALERRERLGGLLDAGAVTIAAFALLYASIVAQSASAGGARGGLTTWVDLAFAVLDVAFVAGAMLAVFGFKRSRWLPWDALFVGGLACFFVGDVGNLILAAQGTTVGTAALGDYVELPRVAGYLCFFLAASFRLSVAGAGEPVLEADRRSSSAIRDYALPAVLVLTIPALLVASSRARGPVDVAVIAASGLLLAVIVVVRFAFGREERDRLRVGAVTDPLTGLPNVRAFDEDLTDAVSEAAARRAQVTLAFFDLDGLELINEVDGREAGDLALRTVAGIVEDSLPASATASRLDAGRFALIFGQGGAFDAYVSCRALVEHVDKDSRLDPVISVACGIASYPEDADGPEALMRSADTAARWARRHGGRVNVYEQGQGEDAHAAQDPGENRDPVRSLQVLAAAIDGSDADTRSHSANVAVLSVALARRIGLDDENVERVRLAGSLHDLGKIGVPDTLLHKEGALTDDERGKVRSHPELGAQMLQATEASELAPWIRGHHERWDGDGYPDGLAGQHIPLAARIIGLADAYDAMTSPRAWRDAMSEPEALRRIAEGAGTQFDPGLVGPFASVAEATGQHDRADASERARRDARHAAAGAA